MTCCAKVEQIDDRHAHTGRYVGRQVDMMQCIKFAYFCEATILHLFCLYQNIVLQHMHINNHNGLVF